jgi:hypothetical protein
MADYSRKPEHHDHETDESNPVPCVAGVQPNHDKNESDRQDNR